MPAIDDDGKALWPQAYPIERLEQIKLAVGSRDWNALYQQRPTPQEGGLIKLGWFNREPPFRDPRLYRRIVASWDTAQKEKEVNDYSVCTVWGETMTGAHLLHVERARLIYPELRDATMRIAKIWRPNALLIEDKASGVSLSQELRAATRLPVIKIEPSGDKVVRAMRVSPTIEAGIVTLPLSAPWLADFELEVSSFPYSAHDDQVDSMTQYLAWANLKAADVSIEPFGAENIGSW
jgi:predicted phage terminase large subunit-like protein